MGTLGGGYRAWFREPLVKSNDHTVGSCSKGYQHLIVISEVARWVTLQKDGFLWKTLEVYTGCKRLTWANFPPQILSEGTPWVQHLGKKALRGQEVYGALRT